jgi:CHAT domain-containing protein/tetratricopeptide (TPR) repeat protein
VKAVKVLACCVLVLPLVGSVTQTWQWLVTRALSSEHKQATRAPVLALLGEGTDLFRGGHYSAALSTFGKMRDAARAANLDDLAARAIGNIGGCQYALHQYQAALQTFLQAVSAAQKANDASAAAIFNANIASLYSGMGELDSAAEWIESSLRHLSEEDRSAHEAKLLIQLATLRAGQNRMPEALRLFTRGLDAADRKGDLELYANGWNRLGEEYLKQHDLTRAETPLLEAYRIRRMNGLALDSSYRSLGLLRLEQGDLASAGALLDRAVELSARPRGPIPTWDIFHQRGRVRIAQGRLSGALDDLRIARHLARGWRWNAPGGDAARVGAENWLDKVHGALVEAGNLRYLETRDPALIVETFEASEENRGSSLRSLLARRAAPPANLPASFWKAIERLQQSEIEALRAATPAAANAAACARAELARMELELPGLPAPPSAGLLDRARAALDSETALLAFYTGDSASWLWSLDRDGLALHQLPARAEIAALVDRVSAVVRTDSPDAGASDKLYRVLFGSLDARVRTKTRWLVALDDGMFETPLAALRIDGRYLAEQHVIQIIPGAGAWLESAAPRLTRRPLFVGVGDAIYNTADSRLSGQLAPAPGALLLPRLVASAREVAQCARFWNGERVLLEGAAASRENLRSALARDPSVVHLATHVMESGGSQPQGLIALSLTPKRESQFLPPQEIAAWRTGAGLVVLSGCHSASAPALPGTGLLGLTRAWLAAGAQTVIASNWPTPDEDGSLFHALYRHLSAEPDRGPSAALRAAQVEMIQSGGWRAAPRYWGAYFAVGAR